MSKNIEIPNAIPETITRYCEGCNQVALARFFMSGPDRMHHQPGCYSLYQCTQCGTISLYPPLTNAELVLLYPENYAPYEHVRSKKHFLQELYTYGVEKQVRAVEAMTGLRAGSALDVGCARGDFLAGLRKRNWQVEGLEMSRSIALEAQSVHGISVRVGDFLETDLAGSQYSLITFWDVIEHLNQPRKALRKAHELVQPGGWLVLSLPNPQALDARGFGPFWAGWDIPRHLWIFPQSAMRQLLADEGWELQTIKWMRGRHWLFSLSMRFWAEEKNSARIRHLLHSVVASPVGRLALWPYFILIERLGLSSIQVLAARRL